MPTTDYKLDLPTYGHRLPETHRAMDAMQNFTFNISPSRVLFGRGKVQELAAEVSRQGLDAVVVLTTPGQTERGRWIMSILGAKAAGIFSEATMHTPVSVTEKAVAYVQSARADSIVSIGGGSTVGLGKAISVRTGLPHICIPTTYAGSEMTSILGETVDGLKKTRSDASILPGTVIYDVDLTMSLPPQISATSGINAMAHAGWYFTLRRNCGFQIGLTRFQLRHCTPKTPIL